MAKLSQEIKYYSETKNDKENIVFSQWIANRVHSDLIENLTSNFNLVNYKIIDVFHNKSSITDNNLIFKNYFI
jgi:hypothetical protein